MGIDGRDEGMVEEKQWRDLDIGVNAEAGEEYSWMGGGQVRGGGKMGKQWGQLTWRRKTQRGRNSTGEGTARDKDSK